MRLGLKPEGILERIVNIFSLTPEPLAIVSWGMGASRSIISGTKLGVFEMLASGPKTAHEVADAIDCDPDATKVLLDALNGFGYLKRRKGYYANTKETNKWLLKDSSKSVYDLVLFMDDLWDMVSGMENGIKNGDQPNLHHQEHPEEFWERYIRGLAGFAKYISMEVVRRVRIKKTPKRLLDVGGGHGVFSIAFCRKYPGLKAEVLDLPEVAKQGRKIISEEGMEDRVIYSEGDLNKTEWGESFDIILISNVVHNLKEEEAKQVMVKAYDALNPGGTLIVLDSEHTGGEKDLSTTGAFNELLFFLTSGAQAYPEAAIRQWIKDAGFSGLRSRYLYALPMEFLLTAKR